MKTRGFIRTGLMAGLGLISIITSAIAETDAKKIEPLALQKIMRDMGKSMQAITNGISREDWALVAKNAVLVADHPQPPLGEKIRILMFAGSNVTRFKEYDGKTHDAAKVLGELAVEEDSYGVIQAFAELQNTCLACHQSFRKSFQEHFYGAR